VRHSKIGPPMTAICDRAGKASRLFYVRNAPAS
jgi:hypothetical protein